MMVQLSRTVRFCINPRIPWPQQADDQRHNTYAGWPTMHGLGAYYELEVRCAGEPDPVTGYVLNISTIDRAVRDHALPLIHAAFASSAIASAVTTLAQVITVVQSQLPVKVRSIRWRLTPYHSIAMAADDLDRVIVSQQFEFAAAHRLHVATLSDEANRDVFGRCNHPGGHGHNYRLEVAVSVFLAAMDGDADGGFRIDMLERIVDETVIKRFDHKHLNLDTREFAKLNPTVENIARICHDLLREPLNAAGARLVRVRLWETEKTSCIYPGE